MVVFMPIQFALSKYSGAPERASPKSIVPMEPTGIFPLMTVAGHNPVFAINVVGKTRRLICQISLNYLYFILR